MLLDESTINMISIAPLHAFTGWLAWVGIGDGEVVILCFVGCGVGDEVGATVESKVGAGETILDGEEKETLLIKKKNNIMH